MMRSSRELRHTLIEDTGRQVLPGGIAVIPVPPKDGRSDLWYAIYTSIMESA